MKSDRALLWFQYAVMGVPAATVPVSWRAPDVPSSLEARVVAVASWMGLLEVFKHRQLLAQVEQHTSWTKVSGWWFGRSG